VLGDIIELSNTFSLFFTAALAFLSFKIIRAKQKFDQERFYRRSIRVIFAYAILSESVYFLLLKFVDNPSATILYKSIVLMLPLSLAIVLALMSYIQAVYNIRKRYSDSYLRDMNIRLVKLVWYPIAMIIIYGPYLIGQIVVKNLNETVF